MNETVIPTGFIIGFASDAPPVGWLVCDGSAINKDMQPRLYELFGENLPRIEPRGDAKIVMVKS